MMCSCWMKLDGRALRMIRPKFEKHSERVNCFWQVFEVTSIIECCGRKRVRGWKMNEKLSGVGGWVVWVHAWVLGCLQSCRVARHKWCVQWIVACMCGIYVLIVLSVCYVGNVTSAEGSVNEWACAGHWPSQHHHRICKYLSLTKCKQFWPVM